MSSVMIEMFRETVRLIKFTSSCKSFMRLSSFFPVFSVKSHQTLTLRRLHCPHFCFSQKGKFSSKANNNKKMKHSICKCNYAKKCLCNMKSQMVFVMILLFSTPGDEGSLLERENENQTKLNGFRTHTAAGSAEKTKVQ